MCLFGLHNNLHSLAVVVEGDGGEATAAAAAVAAHHHHQQQHCYYYYIQYRSNHATKRPCRCETPAILVRLHKKPEPRTIHRTLSTACISGLEFCHIFAPHRILTDWISSHCSLECHINYLPLCSLCFFIRIYMHILDGSVLCVSVAQCTCVVF